MKTYFNVKRYQSVTKERLFLKLKDLKIDYNLFYDFNNNLYYVRVKNDLKRFKSQFLAFQYLDSIVYEEVKKRSSYVMKQFYLRDRSEDYEIFY